MENLNKNDTYEVNNKENPIKKTDEELKIFLGCMESLWGKNKCVSPIL